MPDDTAALLQHFAAGAARLDALLAALPATTFTVAPAADEWSLGAILAHLADSEILAAERFRRIVADPDATLQPLDQVNWAAHLRYGERDPQIAAATFRALRAANVELLRLIPPDAWSRSGHHRTLGPTTLREQVRTFADHTEEHLAQIAALAR